VVDGFFEHHHAFKQTFPYFIFLKSKEPMLLAGIWNDWTDQSNRKTITTFSIVTTKGNALMTDIHNNPKMEEARMPVILPPELAEKWLNLALEDTSGQKELLALCAPYDTKEMDAYTVKTIRGKNAVGNVPEASNPFYYSILESRLKF
jgi:putative SOS response-associated peptidase YedK